MRLHPESVAALQIARARAESGKRTVFVSGTFNIVHPGHLRLLRFAAECGDFLVVGVMGDAASVNAQLGQDTRLDGVSAISWVGHAFLLHDAPENFIGELRPSVVVKGKEHETGCGPCIWGPVTVRLRGYHVFVARAHPQRYRTHQPLFDHQAERVHRAAWPEFRRPFFGARRYAYAQGLRNRRYDRGRIRTV